MPARLPGCVTSLLLATAWALCHAQAADTPADDWVVRHTDATLDAWWLKPEEKRFDEIGWGDGLLAARALSAECGRPVFLFTMDGRVNTGRC